MGLSQEQLAKIKETFDKSKRPLILFDDDPDGLCSFLQVYKHIGEGKGVPAKTNYYVNEEYALKINEYSPDLVVLLDIAVVPQEFFDALKCRAIWIDHHPVLKRSGVEYYNPRISDPQDNRPTSYWIYQVIREDIWLAMTGMIGDWFMPEDEIREEFLSKYPMLLSQEIIRPEKALHESPIGEVVRALSFNLKGKSADVLKSIKILTRINSPEEILEQTTAGGRFIYKKYHRLKTEYEKIKQTIVIDPKEKLLVFTYVNELSFSVELSNELIYKHPEKVIIVAWEYGGEYKCSLRSSNVSLPPILSKALNGIEGYGGGHDHAVGACIKSEDFSKFLSNLKQLI